MIVSIVMCTFNGEKYIYKQLDSIRDQTVKPDEVIFVDDCSSDDTVNILYEYIETNNLKNWKVYTNHQNIGFYNNFFKGISLTKGDIICLSDQDDIWHEKKIEFFLQNYENQTNCMMVQSDMIFIDETDSQIHQKYNYHNKMENDTFLSSFDMCKFCGSGYTMSFRRQVWEAIKVLGYDKFEGVFTYHDLLIGLMSTALGNCYLDKRIKDKHRLHKRNVTQCSGKNFIQNRTREKQIEILEKRTNGFNIIKELCVDESKKEQFGDFSEFAIMRLDMINQFSIYKMIKLFKHRKYYLSRVGLITDIMYSLNMEKLLMYLYSKMKFV